MSCWGFCGKLNWTQLLVVQCWCFYYIAKHTAVSKFSTHDMHYCNTSCYRYYAIPVANAGMRYCNNKGRPTPRNGALLEAGIEIQYWTCLYFHVTGMAGPAHTGLVNSTIPVRPVLEYYPDISSIHDSATHNRGTRVRTRVWPYRYRYWCSTTPTYRYRCTGIPVLYTCTYMQHYSSSITEITDEITSILGSTQHNQKYKCQSSPVIWYGIAAVQSTVHGTRVHSTGTQYTVD